MSRDRLGVLLLLFGASQLGLGLMMALAPGAFFDDIGPYAPRNDHYIRDVATFYLALGGVTVVAWRRQSWRVPVLVFALAQYALHSVNHLVDVNGADPKALGPINLISLVATAALLGGMLWWALQERRGG
jgi:hypothetical protein